VSAATAASCGAAFAQTSTQAAPAETTGLGDIVVTAQRREQVLQDVPIAVTALNEEALEANRVTSARELDTLVPGLAVRTQPGGSQAPFFSMRGKSAGGVGLGEDRAVAQYVDGVFIGSGSGSLIDFANLQQVEVLRGPQGTLFGRNATSGAISFITREPSGEFGVRQTFTAGNYEQLGSTTRIETPQWGPLSAILTYSHYEREGDVRNLGAGATWDFTALGGGVYRSPDRLGDEDKDAVSAVVKWDISPNANLVYRFDLSEFEGTPGAQGIVADPTLAYTNPAICPANCTPVTARRPDAVNNIFSTPLSNDSSGHSLTFTADLNDYLTFKNIAAYRRVHYSAPAFTLDGAGRPSGFNSSTVSVLGYPTPYIYWTSSEGNDEQFSNESQLILDTDAVTLTTGLLYYQLDSTKGSYGDGLNAITAATPITDMGGGVYALGGPVFSTGGDSSVDVVSMAAYAQAEWHLTPQLDLVLGGRFTHDRKDYTFGDIGVQIPGNYEASRPTYMASVNYSATDDVLVYAKYSTGYVSGGTTAFIATGTGTGGYAPGSVVQSDYAPELAYSYEVGMKADWFDHRLRTNLAIYQTDYTGFHVALGGSRFGIIDSGFNNVPVLILDAGDANSWGGELETTWMATDNLTLSAGIAYLDFDLRNVDPLYLAAGANVNPLQSQWTGNFSANYESNPLFNDVRFTTRVDANYRSSFYNGSSTLVDPDGPGITPAMNVEDQVRVDSSWIVNVRAGLNGFQIGGATAEFSIWGKNILDEDYADYTNAIATVSGSYIQAPTYGVDLTFEF
jgi:iron complex outermembrane receptor protein